MFVELPQDLRDPEFYSRRFGPARGRVQSLQVLVGSNRRHAHAEFLTVLRKTPTIVPSLTLALRRSSCCVLKERLDGAVAYRVQIPA